MLKKKSKILLSVLFVLLMLSSVCFATEDIVLSESSEAVTSEAVTTDANSTQETETDSTSSTANWVNTDLYLAEDNVTIDQVVDGNAFVVAKEVTITGEIGGDLFVVADKVTLDGGYIYSSLFVCANEVTINGVVYDVYAVSSNFNLESSGFIYRDLKVVGSNISLSGKIRRDAYISAKSLTLSEESGAIVYGNLNYSAPSEITIPEGSVSGDVKYTVNTSDVEKEISVSSTILSYVFEAIKALLLTFVLTAILLWLAPKFVNRVGSMSVGKSFASLGIGIVTPFVFVIVALLLAISVVGLKMLLPVAFIFIVFSLIASSIASIFFGKLFTKLLKTDSKVKFVLFTLLSNLVLLLLAKIPFIGGFIGFLVYAFGIGSLLVNIVCKNDVVVKKAEAKAVEAKTEKEQKTTKKEDK